MPPLPLLGGLTPEVFLRDYWQKQPLLVRQALPGYRSPIEPEELAGLACEEEVESRLILEKDGATPWQVEHGPFAESRFGELPPTHWTLLVQEINKHVPELALLQERFDFIPNWRLDDVMVSYAPEYGTVGPHADNYDVFLIQGHGRRRWQINRQEPSDDDLLPGLPLKIMRDFRPEQEWVLEPGDMLYLPPGVAHYGVALDPCLTISVGFRAPNRGEILSAYLGEAVAALAPERFYADPELAPAATPGEIAPEALARIRGIIRELPLDDASIDQWFGRFITDVRPGHFVPEPEAPLDGAQFIAQLNAEGEVWRSEYCRYAHIAGDDGTLRLFVAGEDYPLPASLAELGRLLAGRRQLTRAQLAPWLDSAEGARLLAELYNMGCLYFPESDG